MNVRSNFWNKIPSLIAIVAPAIFACSVLYNFIYCFLLGFSLAKIPINIEDFTLTFRDYLVMFLFFMFPFREQIKTIRDNYSDRRIVTPQQRARSNFVKMVLCLFSLFIIFPIWTIYEAWSAKNYFIIFPVFIALIWAPIMSAIILFVKMTRKNSAYLVIFMLSTIACFYLWHIARENIIDSFIKPIYIEKNENQVFLLRTFEKGHLVSDKDYNLSFHYLDSDTVINFARNEELAEYFEKYHKKEEEKENLPEKELSNKK